MATTPTVNTSVPQPSFTDNGVLIPDESDILTGTITDLNAAFGNNLRFYDANGTFLPSRPQSQICSSQTAIINSAFGFLAFLANGFDPAVADGRIQDGICAINFVTQKPGAATSVTCICVGAAGTLIPAGSKVQDTAGNIYASTADATIGASGSVSVVFNCAITGAVPCPAGTLTTIYQIIPGWDSITNPTDGITGSAEEGRADLESRRQQSVAATGTGSTGAILGAVKAVSNVIDAYVVDNKTAVATTIGGVSVPATGVLVSVAGGADADVAQAIWTKVAGGTPLAGNVTVTVQDDQNGYAAPYPETTITFQRAASTPLYVQVTITSSDSIPQDALQQIQTAALGTFGGTGIAKTSMERINSTLYGSAFTGDVRSLGTWAQVVTLLVSLDGSTWADTVSVNATQIPTLVAANVSLVLA